MQNLREQLLGAEEHAAGSQQILEALAACRLACSKSECQFNLSTVKPLLLDMSAGQPESNEVSILLIGIPHFASDASLHQPVLPYGYLVGIAFNDVQATNLSSASGYLTFTKQM